MLINLSKIETFKNLKNNALQIWKQMMLKKLKFYLN